MLRIAIWFILGGIFGGLLNWTNDPVFTISNRLATAALATVICGFLDMFVFDTLGKDSGYDVGLTGDHDDTSHHHSGHNDCGGDN